MVKTIIRFTLIGLGAILLIAAALAGWTWSRLNASLPQIEGEMEMAGLDAETLIIRDDYGVPRIFADTDHDAFFAMGVVHAQDRFFQMDFTRRLVRGRLAEVMGDALATTDARFRIMGMGAAADTAYERLDADVQAALEAYAAGVNSVLESDGYVAPPEYLILRFSPEAWRPQDTVAVYKAIALDLFSNAFGEPAREALVEHLGEERAREFIGRYRDDAPVTLSGADLGLTISGEDAEDAPDAPPIEGPDGGPQDGSNNWVLGPSRTTTGAPILANDPHLGLNAPAIWYLAAMTTPEGSVVGVSLPGTPFITLGRNDHIAWGFTNTGPDTGDLQIVSEDDITTTREERITVRGEDDLVFTRRETAIGPILEPEFYDWAGDLPEGQLYALQYTLDEPEDLTAGVGYRILRARGWDDFVSAIRDFVAPQQNMVFAHRDGEIGFYAPARIPVRDESGAWTGWIPFEELPHVRAPESDFVATANNKIVPDAYPHFITPDWYGVFRITSIFEGIEARERHDLDTMQTLQLDVHSSLAREIVPVLLDTAPQTEAGRRAQQMLAGWDYGMDADSAEALVYSIWLRELNRAVYEDELGDLFRRWFGDRRIFIGDVLTRDLGHWCDDIRTEAEESCATIAAAALDTAMADGMEMWGEDIAAWRYGEVHQARHAHPVFTNIGALRDWFDIRTPIGGDGATVNVAHHSFRNDSWDVVHGASYRALYDLSAPDRSRYIITTGQSGHFLSPHYDDQAALWGRGEYIEIPTGWSADQAPDGAHILRLSPTE